MICSSVLLAGAFRADMRDDVAPYLWSDAELIRYINEGVRQLCIRAWGIRDIVDITFDGETAQTLPPQMLKIKKVHSTLSGKTISVVSVDEEPDLFVVKPRKAEPDKLVVGAQEGKIMPIPGTSAPLVLKFVCTRLPLTPITSVQVDQATELPPDASEGVILYMRHLAYDKMDAETYDQGKSEAMGKKFASFADQYRHQYERREHNARSTKSHGYWS